MNKAEYAVDCFSRGFDCSQAVFAAYAQDFGLDHKLILKLSGTLCDMCGNCGAVSGAVLVLGMMYGQEDETDKYTRARIHLLVMDYLYRFRKLNGSVVCKELLNYDLSDQKQHYEAMHSGVFTTVCPKYVSDAVKILEVMIGELNTP